MMSDLVSTQARAVSSRLRLELIQAATALDMEREVRREVRERGLPGEH